MCRPSHAWLKCGSKAVWDSPGAWDTRGGECYASFSYCCFSAHTNTPSVTCSRRGALLIRPFAQQSINEWCCTLCESRLWERTRVSIQVPFPNSIKQGEIQLPDLLLPLHLSLSLLFCNHSCEPLIQLSARCSPTSPRLLSI